MEVTIVVAPGISAGDGNLVDADCGSNKLAVAVNIEVDAGIAAPGAAPAENGSFVDSCSCPSGSCNAG